MPEGMTPGDKRCRASCRATKDAGRHAGRQKMPGVMPGDRQPGQPVTRYVDVLSGGCCKPCQRFITIDKEPFPFRSEQLIVAVNLVLVVMYVGDLYAHGRLI
jgi:hypothetical protein